MKLSNHGSFFRKAVALATTYITIAATALPMSAARVPIDSRSPIDHLVVIFQENVSFDHYFGTYPVATNPPGEPPFHAKDDTPSINGLSGGLLTHNPNLNPGNGTDATNPFRLSRAQAATADQDHDYTDEQKAAHLGLMDLFPQSVGVAGPPPNVPPPPVVTKGLTMGYYDGNTVTAFWNYAQNFAMSDNSFSTTFGPSTPGLMNLVAGQTNGVVKTLNGTGDETDGGNGTLTVTGDPDPLNDVCSSPTRAQVQMGGKNIGDLLTAAGVSWGSFMGGFDLTATNADRSTGCKRSTTSAITKVAQADYIPHHAFFQYHPSTANPKHTRPSSISEIGHAGPANHNYDINDFFAAVSKGNFPTVSFLKASAYQDGHAGYSDPLDEQQFVVSVINFLQQSGDWSRTAVVIAYDDSDGWYDHQMGPIVNQSSGPADALTGPNSCGNGATALPGPNGNAHALGRCGYGPRLPLLVVSPWARTNFVDHTVTDQTSIIRFIEDTWLNGKRIGEGSFDAVANSLTQMFDFDGRSNFIPVFLDPQTGEPIGAFGRPFPPFPSDGRFERH